MQAWRMLKVDSCLIALLALNLMVLAQPALAQPALPVPPVAALSPLAAAATVVSLGPQADAEPPDVRASLAARLEGERAELERKNHKWKLPALAFGLSVAAFVAGAAIYTRNNSYSCDDSGYYDSCRSQYHKPWKDRFAFTLLAISAPAMAISGPLLATRASRARRLGRAERAIAHLATSHPLLATATQPSAGETANLRIQEMLALDLERSELQRKRHALGLPMLAFALSVASVAIGAYLIVSNNGGQNAELKHRTAVPLLTIGAPSLAVTGPLFATRLSRAARLERTERQLVRMGATSSIDRP